LISTDDIKEDIEMTTVTVYDPPMCCSTGVCGADVDQQLITFAADLDWLKNQGVTVRRINLSQEPTEFTINEEVNALIQASGSDDLPAILVDGKMVSKRAIPHARSWLPGTIWHLRIRIPPHRRRPAAHQTRKVRAAKDDVNVREST